MKFSYRISVAIAASFLHIPVAQAEGGATKLWELGGFANPESALFDAERGIVYVSNVAGDPTGKDGVGYISRISPAGEMLEAEWVTGMNAPKGLILSGGTLYVSDIDQLVAIDVDSGEITNRWDAEGAIFLNDTAVDESGRIYVSDMIAEAIYVLDGDALSVLAKGEELAHPNGLKIADGQLIVATWGRDLQADFSTLVPGSLLSIDLDSKDISALGSGEGVGNLDGLEQDGAGNWLATDWVNGALLRIKPDGSHEMLVDLDMGSADLGYIPADKVAIVPMMMNNSLLAYKVE